jgi:ubiquinone/menaquinone biosynthesis C-methylase UbiE
MKKSEEVKVRLLELVEQVGNEFAEFPWEDPTAYINWLAQTYFIVRHTTCFLALSASRWGVKRRREQYKALAHLREESSHDMLAFNDLEKMGSFSDRHFEWPETQAFYQTQYYWIEHETPAAHLGYAYLLEGIASQKAAVAYKKILKAHGERCGNFMKVHAEEDPHHFTDGLAHLEQLNDYELETFLDCLNQSAFLYSQILAKAKSKAFGFKGFETIIPENIKAPQTLKRITEPSGVTDDLGSVAEYDQVMNTNIAANYSMGLDLIYRARNENKKPMALDLCSGPGHFALSLKKYLNYETVIGMDLSPPMVEVANKNVEKNKFKDEVKFKEGNATNLSEYKDKTFDLVSFTNSAHHFEKIEDVRKVLQEADRVAKDDGMIILTDLGRLKNAEVTDAFVRFAGREFIERKMHNMYRDFYNSMFAAWLPSEMKAAIPQNSSRVWAHIIPKDFSCFQVIVGLPKGRENLFVRGSYNWASTEILKSEEAKKDLWILQQAIDNAMIEITGPLKRQAA